MAGIDKTYVKSFEDFIAVRDWMRNYERILPNGMVLKGRNYLYYDDTDEEDIKKAFEDNEECEIPIMNTSDVMDYFLIRECPLNVVQQRMREVYEEEYIRSVKNGTSEYDTFVRPEGGKHLRLTKKPKRNYHYKWYSVYSKKKVRDKFNIDRIILPDGTSTGIYYSDEYDYWTLPHELCCGSWNSSPIFPIKSLKALARKILKWKLPIGTRVRFSAFNYCEMEGEFLVTR